MDSMLKVLTWTEFLILLLKNFLKLCFHLLRHWREVFNMGADQERVRIATTQPQAKKNNHKLHHRWVPEIPSGAKLSLICMFKIVFPSVIVVDFCKLQNNKISLFFALSLWKDVCSVTSGTATKHNPYFFDNMLVMRNHWYFLNSLHQRSHAGMWREIL